MSETNTDLNTHVDSNEPVDTAVNAVTPEAPKPDTPAHPDWRDRRLANITHARREAEDRAAAERQRADKLDAELAQFRQQRPAGEPELPKPLDPNEIARQAEQRAVERMRVEAADQKFMAECNATAEKIKTEFGDAGLTVAATGWVNAGLDLNKPTHRDLLELITSIDGGHKLYHSLGTDPNFAAHLLELSPMKAAFEIAKLLPAAEARQVRAEAAAAVATAAAEEAIEREQAPAPTPRPAPAVSSAPRPPSQPAASRGASAGSSDLSKMSMADYAAARRKQAAER